MKGVFSSKILASFLFVIAVISLLIFFNFRGWLEIPKNVAFWAISPVLKSFQWVNSEISYGIKTVVIIKDLTKENAKLVQENQRLWQENSKFQETERENEFLRQRLELGRVEDYKFIMADIVGYDNQSGQYFLINKGLAQGIKQDQAVVTANNFLVGRVAEVSQNYAKIISINDSNSIVNALTQDTRVGGIVKGVNGLGVDMEMIPIDKKINVGEMVLSSGKNSPIPKDLIIGKITEIFSKENDIFQKAAVSLAANLGELESVFVLVNPHTTP